MGYDDSLRDFRSFLTAPEILDEIRWLAIDSVEIEAKRPWESYNKAALIRGFPQLEKVILVMRNQVRPRVKWNDIFEFVEPSADPESILRIWVDFKQSFVREEKILEEVCSSVGKPYVQFSLPTVRVLSKKAMAVQDSEDGGEMRMLAMRIMNMDV
jgi:hypothetical protein